MYVCVLSNGYGSSFISDAKLLYLLFFYSFNFAQLFPVPQSSSSCIIAFSSIAVESIIDELRAWIS